MTRRGTEDSAFVHRDEDNNESSTDEGANTMIDERQQFWDRAALAALNGFLSCPEQAGTTLIAGYDYVGHYTRTAVEYANALLAARDTKLAADSAEHDRIYQEEQNRQQSAYAEERDAQRKQRQAKGAVADQAAMKTLKKSARAKRKVSI